MREGEMLLAAVNGIILLLLLSGRLHGAAANIAAAAGSGIVLLLHLGFEGPRWEMIPLYAMILLPLSGLRGVCRRRRKRVRLSIGAAALLYAAGAILLPIALPVFVFEPLAGPYRVGTATYVWTDVSRRQVHADEAGKRRKLLVQFWYPAEAKASGPAAPYLQHPHLFAQALGGHEGVPALLFDSMRLVRTRALEHAPLSGAQARYPVIVYSHGNRGWSGQSTFLTEQLASQGYIVVGIEHAGGTNVTVFPDGEVMPFYADAGTTLDNGAFDRLTDDVWVPDAKFVLDRLEELDGRKRTGGGIGEPGEAQAGLRSSSAAADRSAGQGEMAGAAERFGGRLDLERAGIVGYSLGGAAAAQLLLGDDRLRAGIDMDGGLYGSLRAPRGFDRPFMLMSADRTFRAEAMSDEALAQIGASRSEYDDTVGELLERQAQAAAGGNYRLTLPNTDHTSFSDAPLYSPLLSAASGLDARGAHEVIRVYTVAFFDKYLKGEKVEQPALEAGTEGDYKLIQGP